MTDLAAHPNHAYYAACHGAWRCTLDMAITDGAALRESGMGFFDRLSLRILAAWPRFLGRFVLETTVAYDGTAEVLHTTVVRWLGLPMLSSAEVIVLDPDGRAFTMRGEQRVFPALWRRREMDGQGTIDAEGIHASYDLQWLGARVRQTTERHDAGADIVQIGPGFRGVQPLRPRA